MSKRNLFTLAAAVVIAAALTACSAGSSTPTATAPSDAVPGFTVPAPGDKGGQNNPVKIGVVGASNPQFQVLSDAAQAEGIYLKFQDFTDYSQPNPALSTGQLDLNQF
ncbi:MAG: MetQ/NlpA family ABC transporter substrate-binding protein, partial [Propionibacteriaceae bacterium]|nr:MetQ/NlpA family ABC transporter substrate-binding protein [Propionibacteriaceae bacterium]